MEQQQRQELRERILETAMQAYAAQGIRAVTMDDVARRLNISKRTLYELYDTKETLLLEGVKKFGRKKELEGERMARESKNVIDLMLRVYYKHVDEFKKTNPLFYEDLEKYPRVVALLQRYRDERHARSVEFLKRGVREGYFRKDIDFELVTKMFEAIGDFVMKNQLYKTYSIEEIFRSMVFVSLRGLCTRKGLEELGVKS